MLHLTGSRKRLCSGVTRRDLLQIGGVSALGLCNGTTLARSPVIPRAAGQTSQAKAKACIFVFLFGSPPQHETFDPKPLGNAGFFTRNFTGFDVSTPRCFRWVREYLNSAQLVDACGA